ncbi:alpha-1,2-fucosyltransferase [Rudaeicoccus suwonensis]|uniref:Glycosyl transferase family 11 n=1 Tax=Rudaeicoccus suwonensis TaxID=657409 RepID=A0A561E8Q7_9MICO|nr:alpha-1,2-fucosyltransferase [Rudaeicoccus suwonensis]TWE11991.1 glycosyl transferase family 11 [Rudaeicoccus suwonensis]
MNGILRHAKSALLTPLRRGGQQVVLTENFMGLGNLLYIAVWVAQAPDTRKMLETSNLAAWYPTFPRLRELTIQRTSMPFTAARIDSISTSFGRFGTDFAKTQLHDFCRDYLMTTTAPSTTDRLVINVRRGDYYTDPAARGHYAIDTEAFLRTALHHAQEQEPVHGIHVVSDGIEWCEERLQWLRDIAPLTFSRSTDTPADNLWTVAGARRILIMNSTFSYWAGYLHDVVHPGGESQVWAPRFFSRSQADHASWSLDPDWSIVESIPGGWDS